MLGIWSLRKCLMFALRRFLKRPLSCFDTFDLVSQFCLEQRGKTYNRVLGFVLALQPRLGRAPV